MRIYFILLDSKNERKEKEIMKVLVVFSEQEKWMEAVEAGCELIRETQLRKEGYHFVKFDTMQSEASDFRIPSYHPIYQYFTKREIKDFLKAMAEKELIYEIGQKVLIKELCFDPYDLNQAKLAEASNQIGTIMHKVNGFYLTKKWAVPLRQEDIAKKVDTGAYVGHYVIVPEIEQIMKIEGVNMSVKQRKKKFTFHVQSITTPLNCDIDESQIRLINPECIKDSVTGKKIFTYSYWMYYGNGEPECYTLANLLEYWETEIMTPELIAEGGTFTSWLAEMERVQIYNKKTRVWTED